MFPHTSSRRDESRYMVGGEGIFVGLGEAMGWMALFDGEGWLFGGMVRVMIGIVRVNVSEISSGPEVEEELNISTSMSVASVSLTSSVQARDSVLVEVVSRLVVVVGGFMKQLHQKLPQRLSVVQTQLQVVHLSID